MLHPEVTMKILILRKNKPTKTQKNRKDNYRNEILESKEKFVSIRWLRCRKSNTKLPIEEF